MTSRRLLVRKRHSVPSSDSSDLQAIVGSFVNRTLFVFTYKTLALYSLTFLLKQLQLSLLHIASVTYIGKPEVFERDCPSLDQIPDQRRQKEWRCSTRGHIAELELCCGFCQQVKSIFHLHYTSSEGSCDRAGSNVYQALQLPRRKTN